MLDRPLPWRGERDPYRVLVSEVMLQQTQAARVAKDYETFLARFPTVDALAAADPAAVLRAWGNLGYNRRALNLWRAAATIADRGWPRTIDGLRELPGIGPYTARAVASFAFDAEAGVVDANVRRVLSRVHGLAPDEDVQALADALVPPGTAPRWNQAMIDLGAVVCRARDPQCAGCPIRSGCAWTSGRRPASKRAARPAPRFETTMRYARGRIVSVLRSRRWTTLRSLVRYSGLEAGRASAAVDALEADGVINRRGERIYLGPGAAISRATEASERR
jgi:A/G-specific adenine glycosylase